MNSPLAEGVAESADQGTAWAKRLGYAALTLFLVGFLVTEMVWSPESDKNRSQIWAPLLFLVLPDVALVLGSGRGLSRGQIVNRPHATHNRTPGMI